MPNLFSALPVAILAWVFASTSGLTRTEIAGGAALRLPRSRTAAPAPASDSTLTQRMPSSSASASSAAVLPMPENMIFSGGMPAATRALEFAARHHVGAGAELGQRRDHRLVGIRLHGVADERRHVGEGVGEHAVVPLQRRGRIAIERRADRLREVGEIDRLGVQHAVAIGEVVHGTLGGLSRSASRSACAAAAVASTAAARRVRPAARHPGVQPDRRRRPSRPGGGSSPPLRPQPARPSAATRAPMTAIRTRRRSDREFNSGTPEPAAP